MTSIHTFPGLHCLRSNRFAFSAATSVVHKPGEMYNPLWIYGPSGTGKTALLRSMAAQLSNHHLQIISVDAEQLVCDLICAIQTDTNVEFRAHYLQADVLIVDHLDSLRDKLITQQVLGNLFAESTRLSHQVILSSTRPAQELCNLHDELLTRCEWFLCADIQLPNFTDQMALLSRLAQDLGLTLTTTMSAQIINFAKSPSQLRSCLSHLAARSALLSEDQAALSDALERLLTGGNPA